MLSKVKLNIYIILSTLFLPLLPQLNILVVTIPKAGTHLINKTIFKILNQNNIAYAFQGTDPLPQAQFYNKLKKSNTLYKTNLIQKINQEKSNYFFMNNYLSKEYWIKNPTYLLERIHNLHHKKNIFLTGHTEYNTALANNLIHKNYRIILLIRDPRDRLVSNANFILTDPLPANHPFKNDLENKSLSELIDILMETPKKIRHNAGVEYHKKQLQWYNKHRNNCLIIKFEDLVGPQGGGSTSKQLESLKKIYKHLNLQAPKESNLLKFASSLYGGTFTFDHGQKGQIGNWKNIFTEKQKQHYKSIEGNCQLLIDLNYEKDDKW